MKQNSRRKKGKLLQNLLRDKILKAFPHLKKKDVDVAGTGENGPDIKLSSVAKQLVPYSFETKNQEKMKTIYDWYNQSDNNTPVGLEPVLVIKQNSRRPLCVIDLKLFIELIKIK
jgi:hypothetical protein|tara:strand:+ start:2433 stop:2777 length:345 start_codon:yes stop_codon:yes gene_type:complete